MTERYYAGIGSRDTPLPVLQSMKEIAEFLRPHFVLRSGHAGGADSAFESHAEDRKQIFLPYDGFNGGRHDGEQFFVLSGETEKRAKKLAEKYHPAWNRCGFAARRFHTRNVPQVLGPELNNPVEFVVCYTERGLLKGGTAQAMRIANDHDIPIYNLGRLSKNDVLYLIQLHHMETK
jgi:hypothetical protein